MSPDRKSEILRAAGTCFARFGYEKTTLDDIGSMVGINKVSLYHYFKNKEAIFAELIALEADQYGEALKAKVRAVKSYKQKIVTWIREGFKYNETNSVLHQFTLESLSRLAPQLEELKESALKKGVAFFSRILEEAQQAGEVGACDTARVAQAIQSMVYAMKDAAYQRARSNPEYKVDLDTLAEEILFPISLVLDGIAVKKSR
jgi:AcrR family transcriptional regulator